MIDRFPLFLLFIVGITCLVLTMAFRSIVIALKAALTTGLSALAAFGALVAVFEWGWLQGVVGLDQTGPTASFLPVIVLSILFGLSMDYEVFLASRIREEYVKGGDAKPAVTAGVRGVGRVIMAAAVIMGVVFWAFVLTDDRTVKSFGLGLGVAILVDALIVRMLLVPARHAPARQAAPGTSRAGWTRCCRASPSSPRSTTRRPRPTPRRGDAKRTKEKELVPVG